MPQQADMSACCLKMADERTKAPFLLARSAQVSNQKSPVPEKYSWPSLSGR
jgi:hypothetical protein